MEDTNKTHIWSRYREILFGGFYLSPILDIAACTESVGSYHNQRKDYDDPPIIMMGNFNMRLGSTWGTLYLTPKPTQTEAYDSQE